MIGISTFIRLSHETFCDNRDLLKKEDWHVIEVLLDRDDSKLFVSKHKSYPIVSWSCGDFLVVLEGAIFNYDEEIVVGKLNSIIQAGVPDEEVDRFVSDCDGDYIVAIKNVTNGDTFIFNDILGNIPINYYYNEKLFVASRSLTYIAIGLPSIKFSTYNLAENLTLDYNLHDHTIFEGIHQTMPAQEIKCRIKEEKVFCEVRSTYNHSFCVTEPYKNVEEAAKDLASLFLEGCYNRVKYAKDHGYEIVNTMSGGFDSRTVLGGIDKYTSDFLNVTYEYIQDESEVAKKVLSKIGTKSKFVKFSYENNADYKDDRLTFITDGKINSYTNTVCYHDLQYGYLNYFKGKKIMYFGGFGGEFIRHPYFSSVYNQNNITDRYLSPSLNEVCKVLGINNKDEKKRIKSIFTTIPGAKAEEFCKRLYSEYYTKYVRGAGEERMRMFYFTTQPLMAKGFIMAARNKLPLKWCGFRFYKLFLSHINPALNEIEVYGNKPNIHSSLSLLRSDYLQKSYVYNKLKYLVKICLHKDAPLYNKDILLGYINESIDLENYLDKDYLLSNYSLLGKNFQNKIVTFLQYYKEITKKR